MKNDDLLMELADCGSPEKLAKIIHKHIPLSADGCTDLDAVAKAVGIIEIKEEPSDTFEGILVTSAEKSKGVITLNSKSAPARRRFTLGHEIGHFVIPTHDQSATCLHADVSMAPSSKGQNRTEAEADSFASELLMPTERLTKQINSHIGPELEKIIALAEQYKVSKESMIRKYMPLSAHQCAIFFARDDKMVKFPVKGGGGFPFISINPNDKLPPHITEQLGDMSEGDFSDWYEVDPHFFLSSPEHANGSSLLAQTYRQVNGFSITLLSLEKD